jgi:hypothetical protein
VKNMINQQFQRLLGNNNHYQPQSSHSYASFSPQQHQQQYQQYSSYGQQYQQYQPQQPRSYYGQQPTQPPQQRYSQAGAGYANQQNALSLYRGQQSSMAPNGRPHTRGHDMRDSGQVLGGGRSSLVVDPQMMSNALVSRPKAFDNTRPVERYVLFVSRVQGRDIFEPNSQRILDNMGNFDKEFRIVCVQTIPKSQRPPGLKMTPAIMDTKPPGGLYQGTGALRFLEHLKNTAFRVQPVPVNMGTSMCKLGFNCWLLNNNNPEFQGGMGLGMGPFQRRMDGTADPRYRENGKISQEDAATYNQYRSELNQMYQQKQQQTVQAGTGRNVPASLKPINDNIRNRNQQQQQYQQQNFQQQNYGGMNSMGGAGGMGMSMGGMSGMNGGGGMNNMNNHRSQMGMRYM